MGLTVVIFLSRFYFIQLNVLDINFKNLGFVNVDLRQIEVFFNIATLLLEILEIK